MNLSPKYVSAANKQCRFDPEEPEDMDEDVQITVLFACRMVMGPLSHRDFDFPRYHRQYIKVDRTV